MKYIKKIKLKNFKRFRSLSVPLYKDLNVIVGENESGKSTILSAINCVLGGNRKKIETIQRDKVTVYLSLSRHSSELSKLSP